MSRDTHSHDRRQPKIREYYKSGLSISEFDRRNNFTYDSFYWHLQKEGKKDQKTSGSLEIVPVIEEDSYHPAIERNHISLLINSIHVTADDVTVKRLLGIMS